MRVWSVEGNEFRLDGGSLFGNAPRVVWEKWMTPDDKNRLTLSARGMLVDDLDGKRVLFEPGVGAFFSPEMKERYGVAPNDHKMLQSLAARGVSHTDIDAVVVSHMHFDHAGGLLSAYEEGKPLQLLFPKARILVSELSWERANAPHDRDRASFIPELNELLKESGRLELVREGVTSSLGEKVKFTFSHGHSPGMILSEVGGDGGVVFIADFIPGRPWVHVPLSMGFDRFPELLIDEKKSFLEDAVARNLRIFFAADAGCAMARPIKDAKGRFRTVGEVATVDGMVLE